MSRAATAETDAKTISLKEFTKTEVKILYKNKLFQHVAIGNREFIDMREAENLSGASQFVQLLRAVVGSDKAYGYNGIYPVRDLARVTDRMREYHRKRGSEIEQNKDIVPLLKILDGHTQSILDAFNARKADGLIEFDDIPLLFVKDAEVMGRFDGEILGGIVHDVEFFSSMFEGVGYKVKIRILHALKGSVEEGIASLKLYAWDELKKISELSVAPAEGEIRKHLEERGRLFTKASTGAAYMRYRGEIRQHAWFGNQTFRADGRVMVDPRSCARVDSDRLNQEFRHMRIDGPRGSDFDDEMTMEETSSSKVPEKDLWRTFPFVIGFSFRAKKWGTMRVADLSDIEFRTDAFDYLVMPEEDKEIIRALVETQEAGFQDLIDEKGGGTIFLLAGVPGVGKTLTAETVAEMLKRPLYSVSIGELGTEPSELEDRLRVILDVATVWDAVILLDEADIFLEKRDTKDIVRNAMVGVFLRLLEYHQGTLFLTTNRDQNIDPAFFSRITVPLSFGKADGDKMRMIWHNLLTAAKIRSEFSEAQLDALAALEINGRQIKTAIRTGQKLAAREKRTIAYDDLLKPVRMAKEFQDRSSERTIT